MKKPLSICLDARMAAHSGIGTYIRQLCSRLKDECHLCLIVDQQVLDKVPQLSLHETMFMPAPLYSLKEQILLPTKIPAYDLFWSPNFNIPLLPIRARKRVVTLHDVYFLAHAHTLSIPKRVYTRYLIKQAALRCDRIITISDFSKKEICRYTPVKEDQIDVIPLAADPSPFLEPLDRDWALPETFILFVGNLAPHKNIEGLVRAFRLVHEKRPQIHLFLVGKDVGFHRWKEELRLHPEIVPKIHRVEGATDREVGYLYRKAKALVFPSFYEGFGLPPLEAMSLGCPVVASNAASLPQVCGSAALLVDPHSEQALAHAIEEAVFNPQVATYLKEEGLKQSARFSWDVTAQKHLETFEKSTETYTIRGK